MAKFIEGQYRRATGYLRQQLSQRNIQRLSASGEIDDEFWILLEYYSEVENVGLNYLKQKGIQNSATRRKVFKHFQAHVRQAKSYYYSAKVLPPRSSGLLYYYCFLNLAKSVLVIKEPNIAGKEEYHGLNYKVDNNSPFRQQTLNIKPDGIFPKLYDWYFGQTIKLKQVNISSLLSYCTDISYQCKIAGIHDTKILYSYYAHCVDKNKKLGWALVGIPQSSVLLKYPKSVNLFLKNYEKIELPQLDGREMFKLDAFEQSSFVFFQSIKTTQWISDNIPPALEVRDEIMKALKNVIQVNYFANDYDFLISLPYKTNRQTMMDETIAIYLIMFYLSNLVRYKPQYLEGLLSKKEAWLIDSFVRSCPITFLRSMISRIIGTDYIIEKR